MNPKDALREEHGMTMKMLAVFQRFFLKLVDQKQGDGKDLEEVIAFFELYVDRCHHGKEEELLFPALSRASTGKIEALISSLIDEHRRARMDLEQMKTNAANLHSSTEADRDAFRDRMERYVESLRKHIRKENAELLPLIEERLSETEQLRLTEQFHHLEKAILSESRLEALLAGVQRLSEKYSLQ